MRAPAPFLLLVAAIALSPAENLLAAPVPSDAGGELTADALDNSLGEREPWISDRMSSLLNRRLGDGLAVAAQRIRDTPRCQALFADLGRDGLETLLAGRYYPATQADERGLCRDAAALTSVGGRRVRLCRRFASLHTNHTAVILIHEALHHAGLPEYPSDREAMASPEINWMVKEGCAL